MQNINTFAAAFEADIHDDHDNDYVVRHHANTGLDEETGELLDVVAFMQMQDDLAD